MIEYVDINAALPLVSKAVRSEDTVPNLISYMLDGWRLIYSPAHTEEGIIILEVKDHKVALPKDIKKINLATYMESNPDTGETEELTGIESRTITIDVSTTDEEENTCVGNYILSHRLFLLSDYFNNNYQPMKYIGTSPFVCTNCNNRFCHSCNETYSVDHNKILHTSFKDGYICLIYETEIKKDGVYQVINNREVLYYLARYAEQEHFRDRAYSQETNAINIKDRIDREVNVWYNKARSAIKKLLINRPLLTELTTARFNARFLRDGGQVYRNRYE